MIHRGQKPHHWALLIGINFYVEEVPLKGPVNDVELMQEYFRRDKRKVDIQVLKASSTAVDQPHPPENPAQWPTVSNIESSIERIKDNAQEGDFVYIHFSGHGTRTLLTNPKIKHGHKDTGDATLIVLGDDGRREEDLNGRFLAIRLKWLVDKGLKVTLVLDCCYSGHVYRHSKVPGAIIRTSGRAQPTSSSSYPTSDLSRAPYMRNAEVSPEDWLLKPAGYTILTACGPHEVAREVDVAGQTHGALTWFLHESLMRLQHAGGIVSQQSLHNHLVARMHSVWPSQTPMCYGRTDFCFFSDLQVKANHKFVLVEENRQKLVLQAGRAHGIYEGDEYALYPFDASENSTNLPPGKSFRARVSSVDAITSDLDVLEPRDTAMSNESGWKAKALTSISPHKIKAGLLDSIGNPSQWEAAARGSHFLEFHAEESQGRSCQFYLESPQNETYRILDSSGDAILGFPFHPAEDSGVSDEVLRALEHMATFKFIEGLDNRNPNPQFEAMFRYTLLDQLNSPYDFTGTLDVDDATIVTLEFENLSQGTPLYMTVLDMNPSWGISCLTRNDGAAGYYTVLPRCSLKPEAPKPRIRWKMYVPEHLRKQGYCEDIVKIIVTNKPTSFSPFLLSKITEASHRGAAHGLSKLLARLNPAQRSNTGEGDDPEFSMVNIIIRTHFRAP
ncbi:caspase family protein [Aspergillus saccharolyticus JOP 1030-1]|uniref:Peptidase C14 caspase domain-containing protein n=1 Tax=Aspergillus saccharolyticus JOP 1030-1 TaxID=1450539 RepID=A0A318ZIW2_9EURO|nr:hypothetical protein BP01DRAFT_421799 [Aspergillus saccharolyticus JOP 1030-1]PYH47506.1 hypothetical protein BP01DRAFT_421799 [Aspergillus saccharolyticus JOP 1030-1]